MFEPVAAWFLFVVLFPTDPAVSKKPDCRLPAITAGAGAGA
jgi:hypothetical protein